MKKGGREGEEKEEEGTKVGLNEKWRVNYTQNKEYSKYRYM